MAKNFSMSYGTLMLKARAVAIFVMRDIAQFAAYNVVADDVTTFLASVEEFEALPTNEGLQEEETLLTEAKEEKIRAIQAAIKEVQTRAAVKFGAQSKKFAMFSLGEFHRIKDSEMQAQVQKFLLHTNMHFDDLETVGLTAAMVTAISDALAEFVTAVEALTVSIAVRDKATEIREKAANAIYEVILDWCTMGKAIWQNESEAYYDDYIIYDADDLPHFPPSAVQGFGYDVQSGMATWLDSDRESSYEAEIDENGAISEVNIEQNVTELAAPMGATMKRIRIRARNAAGVGPWSDWLEIPAAAQPPMPTNLQYLPPANGNPGVTTADAPAGAIALRMFYQADGHPKNEVGVMADGEYSWTLWLIPGTIFVRAEFPGGIVSAEATLRVE